MSEILRPWVQTASGGRFDLIDPRASQVCIRDIAEALAKTCRFNGHTQYFYSVAQHSCLVMELLTSVDALPYGLLHDAHEAYMGDLTTPVRNLLAKEAGYDIWSEINQDIERVIHEAFGLKWPPHPTLAKLVKEADLVALATEKRDVMADGPLWEIRLPQPDTSLLRPWSWVEAHHNFIDRFQQVCKVHPSMKNTTNVITKGDSER
ncbi:MAG: phosphohydrolase [Rhodospirillales bacterium]|nr:phosphohydrolase [Rhodospirillales bacterium]MCB9994842.1 phosphohydrolase [Rhodospirillales bacterium]